MKAHMVAEVVYCLYADVQAFDLFEGIWPILQEVSLNSHV